jgi:prepilin-type processing-associated H-X9-DG protein
MLANWYKWNSDKDKGAVYAAIGGKALDIVPKALANGGSFLTFSEVMARRVEVAKSSDKDLTDTWFNNGFWCLTPIFYDNKGNVAVGDIKDEKVMNYVKRFDYTVKNDFYFGRVRLPVSFKITDISGCVFNKKDIAIYGNKLLSEKDAKENILWHALAGNNLDLHKEFVEHTYKIGKDKYNKTGLMGVWLDDVNLFNSAGLFLMYSLDKFDPYASDAIGYSNFYYMDGHVVKVQTQEMQAKLQNK